MKDKSIKINETDYKKAVKFQRRDKRTIKGVISFALELYEKQQS